MARNLKVEARLIADTGAYTAGIRKAMADTDRFGRSTKKAGRGDVFGGLAKNALKAAAATASLYTVYDQGKKAVNTTLDLAKSTKALTRTTGLSTQEASRFVAVSKVRGIENTKLAASFTILSKQIAAAQKGSEASTVAFQKLGVSQDAIRAGNTREVFLQAADGLSKMANGANKTALAAQLFGRGYQALFPLLDMGSKGIAEQLKLAGDLGAELSGRGQDSVLKFAQAQREAKLAQMGLQVQLGQVLIPTLTKGVAALSAFIIQFRQGKGAGGELRSTLEGIRAALQPVTSLLAQNPRLILAAAGAWVSFKATVGGLRLAETILNVLPTVAQMTSRGRLAGSALSKGFAAGLLVGFVLLQPDIDKAQKSIFAKLKKSTPGFSLAGKDFIDALANGLMKGAPGLASSMGFAIKAARAFAQQAKGGLLSDGKALATSVGKGIRSAAGSVASAAASLGKKALSAVKGFIGQFFGVGQSMGSQIAGGIRSAIGQAVQAARDIIEKAKQAAESAKGGGGGAKAGAAPSRGSYQGIVRSSGVQSGAPISTFAFQPEANLLQNQRKLEQLQAAYEKAKSDFGEKRSKAESRWLKTVNSQIQATKRAVTGFENAISRRDALAGIQDQFKGFVDQAVSNFREALKSAAQNDLNSALARLDEATGNSPEAQRLRALRAEQDRLAREREDSTYRTSRADLEAQIAKATANGNVKAQAELNAQLASLDQDRRDTERQREIDALSSSLQAQRDNAQSVYDARVAAADDANNADVAIFQAGLQAKLAEQSKFLSDSTIAYAMFAQQVNKILSDYGLSGLLSTSGSDELAIMSPQGATISLPKKPKKGKKKGRASGGMLSRSGLTLVGETGPELISGGNVYSATRTARMNGAGVTLNVYPQTTADDPVALARALGWQLATR